MKKKLTYEQEQKKIKVKNRIKWGIAISGWSLLAFAFVGLIGLQVSSCARKKNAQSTNVTTPVNVSYRRSVTNNDFEDIYYIYNDSFDLRYDDFEEDYEHQGYDTPFTTTAISNCFYDLDNARYESLYNVITKQTAYFNVKFYRAFSHSSVIAFELNFHSDGTNYLISDNLIGKSFKTDLDLYDNAVEAANANNGIFNTEALWGVYLGRNSSTTNESYLFNFDYQINRYAPLGGSNDNAIYVGDNILNGSYSVTKRLLNGLFSDLNGVLYRGISITYIQGQGTRYLDSAGNVVTYSTPGTQFLSLNYIDMNGNVVTANHPIYTTIDNNVVYTNASSWVSSVFNSLRVYKLLRSNQTNDFGVYEGFTPNDILSSFNLANNSGVITGGGNLQDVFSLLAMAFTSFASICAISIIPGVTIGTLMFLPFVIMVIIFIVWLFKR